MGIFKGLLATAALWFFSAAAQAQGFDQQVEALVRPLANALSSVVFYKVPLFGQPFPLIVLWLASAAVFFTLYLGFINIRGFGLALRHVRGLYHNPEARGEISHFQAVATAISGTVGIGNIGGVAVAIVIGGPWCRLLVDCGRLPVYVHQAGGVHAGGKVPPLQCRRLCIGRSHVLPGAVPGRPGGEGPG